MTLGCEVAGAAETAELHDPVRTAGIVRVFTSRVRRACEDGSLHAHRDHAGHTIPLVCALAWRAGHDAGRQRALCPLCMVLARVTPGVGPRPRA
jgi:hypothetical protein